ncbi:MAG: DUF4124 domain-containing protein [Desulfobacterales bacterium]|jgi:uncharacterized protein involved in exopolysaccharide biosynthesis
MLTGAIVGIILLCGSAAAQIYKYVDPGGALRFTDDITQVPEDQREQITTYEEITPSAADQAAQSRRGQALDRIIEESRQAEQAAATRAVDARAAGLKAQKAELEEKAKALEKELEQLGPLPSRAAPGPRLRIYNTQAQALNAKQSALQKEKQQLEGELNQFAEETGRQELKTEKP